MQPARPTAVPPPIRMQVPLPQFSHTIRCALQIPQFLAANILADDGTRASRSALKARERTNPTKFRSVGLLSFFAPDAERFLGRAVGDREQHGFLRRLVGVTLPWRHDKDVIWPPFEERAVDLGRAAALDADENRAVGRAVRC